MQIKQRQIIIIIIFVLPLVIIEQFAKATIVKLKRNWNRNQEKIMNIHTQKTRTQTCMVRGWRERKRLVSTLYRMVLLKCEQAGMQRQHLGWDRQIVKSVVCERKCVRERDRTWAYVRSVNEYRGLLVFKPAKGYNNKQR